jgi:chromosome segregation ATPase
MTACLLPASGRTAEEESTARLREQLHRTQEALRQAQAEQATLTQQKSDAQQKLASMNKELDTTRNGSRAARADLQKRMDAQQQAADTARKELQARLDERSTQLKEALDHQRETAAALLARQSELDQTRKDLAASRTAGEQCEVKNVTLYGYAQEVLQRYKNKGVWASLAQKDPVLGLKEVDVENVVQEYQLKYDSQKVKP